MIRKNPQGTIIIVFETDLNKTRPLNESILTPLQRRCLSQMSQKEQEQVRAGYGIELVDLLSGKKICDFNMENYQPPQSAIENFARMLLPEIKEYYSHEENRREFEEQKSELKDSK